MTRPAFALVLAWALTAGPVRAGEPKLKAEDVLVRHLTAIGPANSAATARTLKGRCAITAPASGDVAGALVGQFTLASTTSGFRLGMRFASATYPAEAFSHEGEKPAISFVQPGIRSALGNFLIASDVILTEGLLGGVLNARWPLLALAERGAKLQCDGLKKFDGRELYRLSYRARKGQEDLEVRLFFEPDTFRHVASVYRKSRAQAMGTSVEQSSKESDTYFQLEETFGDFQAQEALVLPTAWTMRYETQGRASLYWKYDMQVQASRP